jgi:hypothetical protein
MSLTIAPSPFGSLVVSVAETGSTLSVTTVATSPAVLSMALGVPGPAGSQGPAGSNGVGVPVGGTTGQVLAKIDGTNYNTEWVDAGAAGDFLPLSGGTMSGAILFDAVGGQNISKGSFDSGRGGYNGISLNCANLYELNWQSGYLKNIYNNAVAPINVESDMIFPVDVNGNDSALGPWGFGVENIDAGQSASIEPNQIAITTDGVGTAITSTGVTFPDDTVQTTAALPLTGGTVTGTVTINDASTIYLGDGVQITDAEQTLTLTGSGILFSDNSTQNTAFPPTGGTTTQYIDGTGALQTYGPLGDRYLTSSTSTLTCDSGNGKTMTVGTGLSYSRQQDITVSYNNSNHMHGTVLTYDSATGVMTWDSNTHSGSGTYSSWEVNVGGVAGAVLPVAGTSGQVLAKINSTNFNTEWISLGTMATATATDYLAKADNLSGLASTSTARTNLGLGSMATATTTDYLDKAGNLSGLASTSTARTNLGLGAVSTDAYATTAQAQAGTSTTTVVNPATLLDAKFFGGAYSYGITNWATATSGAGASAGAQNGNARLNGAPTTAIGYAVAAATIANSSRGGAYSGGYDFTKRVMFGSRIARNVASPDSASVWRLSIGKFITTATIGDLTSRGLMIKVAGSGALQLMVHNGTALTTTTSSFTPSNASVYDVVVTSDGAGNCALFVNGSSVATSTGGPTANSGASYYGLHFETENTSVITGSPQSICISNTFVQVNV